MAKIPKGLEGEQDYCFKNNNYLTLYFIFVIEWRSL